MNGFPSLWNSNTSAPSPSRFKIWAARWTSTNTSVWSYPNGGVDAAFTTFHIGKEEFLNLIAARASVNWWGRVIVRVQGVDALYEDLKQKGLNPEAPRDGEWGERFFHIQDPDHHELSFAELLT